MLDRRESEIVTDAQAGNRQAFGKLVERYQNLVTSLAFSKTGDLQRSEDIAQQAFLLAWQKRSELRDPEKFGGWLRAIVRNLTMNSNRKSQRIDRSAKSLDQQDVPLTFESPEAAMGTKEQQDLLWESLKNIPESYRESLILFYRQDQSIQEVADQLGLSVDAVKQRLSRGRAMLKSEVEQFVEDLLATSKPSNAFAPSVLMLIPSASQLATQISIKAGSTIGAKTMLGKLGVIFSGPLMGVLGGVLGGLIGVAGAWYGTDAAAKQATSEEEKTHLWKFFWLMLGTTALVTAASLLISFSQIDAANKLTWWAVLTSIDIAVLTFLIIRFINRQKSLHQQHGKPNYLRYDKQYAATPAWAFKMGVVGTTIGCWVWVFVLTGTRGAWWAVLIALPIFLGHIFWTVARTDAQKSSPDHCRFQAMNLLLSGLLTSGVFVASSFLFEQLDFGYSTTLAIGLFVSGTMWIIAGLVWSVAGVIEKQIASEAKAQ